MPTAPLLVLAAALAGGPSGCAARAVAAAAAAADERTDAISLMQVAARLGNEAAPAPFPSALAVASSRAAAWPNPADPNAQPNVFQKATIALLKRFPHNMVLVNRSLSAIALTPVWYVVENGGYDILFRALRDFADEPTVQMNAWRGLSDQSHTEVGSNLIANYGGPNQGIVYMVQQMQAHPKPYEAECADWLTYKYEVLQCISGLLEWDVNGTRGAAAVQAGLLEQIVYTMRVEGDLRPSMDVACNCMDSLLSRNASYAPRLRDLGAVELTEQAIKAYSKYDPTPFYFGTTYGQAYPVAVRCAHALTILLAAA